VMLGYGQSLSRGREAKQAGKDPAQRSRPGYRHWFFGILVLLLGAYLASGFYVVGADERAVVRRFGAVEAVVGPGMHSNPRLP